VTLSVIHRAALAMFHTVALGPGAKVLDAPCGSGALVLALRSEGYDAHGLDIDAAGTAPLGTAFRRADLTAPFPWPDASFDVVLSVEGIEHLENRFAYLREIHRILKPGGTLILTTTNVSAVRSRVRFFASGFHIRDPRPLREASPDPMHHIALGTFPDLRYMLHTTGFALDTVGHTHIKPVSWLYAWMVPWMWVYTRIAFRKERDAAQRRANVAIRSALFSKSVLFGENLLLTARRRASTACPGPTPPK
jgi:SAM-dependent methyltransferase